MATTPSPDEAERSPEGASEAHGEEELPHRAHRQRAPGVRHNNQRLKLDPGHHQPGHRGIRGEIIAASARRTGDRIDLLFFFADLELQAAARRGPCLARGSRRSP